MNFIHSVLDKVRDNYAPISTTSTFRQTGQITPEEFLQAGDFLVYKFPSWSWADASTPEKRVAYLPAGKQYLVTRGVPCRRRLNDNFAGQTGLDDVVRDGLKGSDDDDDGWLRTGGDGVDAASRAKPGDVRTMDEAGEVSGSVEEDDEDEIPDMEDEEDDEEAIIREPQTADGENGPLRTYTVYITYTPYYRTPRLYLSGYTSSSPSAAPVPLVPEAMMEDIVGDYKDKTVTLEDFPYVAPTIKTASVHPCRHASVMKVLLDRADAALKLRTAKMKRGLDVTDHGMEGLVDQTTNLDIAAERKDQQQHHHQSTKDGDEWEVLSESGNDDDEVAIRVDQYLIVFLKFMASVTPGIEHDFTMGV
ncbi:hypothetical protein AAFC00_004050 [Neodothiora populina]|uniref:Autophagy-related protein 3 n=1 Tax=Neodothiora populina TaxID=2781224 RepID=A0ABR3PID8_9PEZI